MHATRTVAAALALLLAAAPTLAQQQRVYQWKDAKGVTHYADLPPTQAHKSRDIDNKGNTPEIATVKPVENEQCANSRSNLTRLQTNQAVGVDTNGDRQTDLYQNSAAITDWSRVLTLRLQLILGSAETGVVPQPQSLSFNGSTFTAPDTRWYTSSVVTAVLRNRLN